MYAYLIALGLTRTAMIVATRWPPLVVGLVGPLCRKPIDGVRKPWDFRVVRFSGSKETREPFASASVQVREPPAEGHREFSGQNPGSPNVHQPTNGLFLRSSCTR